jgi:hypothetical protein
VGQQILNNQWYALGYTEKGADTWNWPIIKKGNKEDKKRRKRIRKREDTCIVADEQPSTLGVPDFRKVLGYRSP